MLIFVGFISCNKEDKLKIIEGNAIGTTFSIRYLDISNIKFETKIDSLILAVNKSVSTYISTSDISKINKGDSTVLVDHFFEEIFLKSEKFTLRQMEHLIQR